MTDQKNGPVIATSGLLTCPFCGSAAVDPEGWVGQNPDGSERRSGPACDDCGGSADTITLWNTRHHDEGTAQVINALRMTAKTLGAYALNVAYGGELYPFELNNLVGLAKVVGCTVEDRHTTYAHTRAVLGRVLRERHVQVERHGHTPEQDDHNPERLHQEVLARVQAIPSEHEEQNLLEAATIIVAVLESITRKRAIAPPTIPADEHHTYPGTPTDGAMYQAAGEAAP